MYAMTGRLIAQNGKRDELVEILTQASYLVGEIPECHLYVVNEDLANESFVWIYELWEDKHSHDESLSNEHVRELISRARPLLAAAPDGAELHFAGGHGVDIQYNRSYLEGIA